MNQNIQFEEQRTETAFERFMGVAQKTFSGVPFLVLTIILTVMAGIQLLSTVVGEAILMVPNLISLAMMIITTVGCWLVWSGAKNGKAEYASKLGLCKVYPTFMLVIYYIVTSLFAIAGIIAIAAASMLNDLIDEFSDVLEDMNVGELGDILSEIGDGLVGIIIVAVVIVLAVMVFFIIRYTMLVKIIGKVKKSIDKKEVPQISPMFFCVLSFIFGGFTLLGSLGSMLFNPLSGISTLMSVGVMVLPAIILLMVKNDLEDCVKQEKEEKYAPATTYEQNYSAPTAE